MQRAGQENGWAGQRTCRLPLAVPSRCNATLKAREIGWTSRHDPCAHSLGGAMLQQLRLWLQALPRHDR